MALKQIVYYPNEVLTRPTEPVTDFGPELAQLAADMAETMYANNGLGLAANQVGVGLRLFVADLGERGEGEGTGQLRVFVNPKITAASGQIKWEEACLSFPKLAVEVGRAEKVTVQAQDVQGQPFELTAEGLFAVAIQHETDHLDGATMLDRLGRIGRKLALRRYQKLLAGLHDGDDEQDEQRSSTGGES